MTMGVFDFKAIARKLNCQEQRAEFEAENSKPEPAMYGCPCSVAVPFSIVHQGGHHTVWCDGNVHKKSGGGYAACYDQGDVRAPKSFSGEFPCDCKRWRQTAVDNILLTSHPQFKL